MLAFLFLVLVLFQTRTGAAPMSFGAYTAPTLAHTILFGRQPVCDCSGTMERTLVDIIRSCLFTIAACVYRAIHQNIPDPEATWWQRQWLKTKITLLALLAPEMMIWWAMKQWMGAKVIKDRLNLLFYRHNIVYPGTGLIPKWTLTHGHFLQMGGLIRKDNRHALNPDNLVDLFIKKQIHLDSFRRISQKEIEDHSKGDALSKAVVAVQTTWFVLECLVRLHQNLRLTELEVATLAFAVLNMFTYGFWWHKPLNVLCPIAVDVHESPMFQSPPREPPIPSIGPQTVESRQFEPTGTGQEPESIPTPPPEPDMEDLLRESIGAKDIPLTAIEFTSPPLESVHLPLDTIESQRLHQLNEPTGIKGVKEELPTTPDLTSPPPPESTHLALDIVKSQKPEMEVSHPVDGSRDVDEEKSNAPEVFVGGKGYTARLSTLLNTWKNLRMKEAVSKWWADLMRDIRSDGFWDVISERLIEAYFGAIVERLQGILTVSFHSNALHVPTFYASKIPDRKRELVLYLASLIGMIFGAIHLLSWNSPFHTQTEATLWRISSVILVVQPFLVALTWTLRGIVRRAELRWAQSPIQFLGLGCLVFSSSIGPAAYVLARFCILALAFLTLRTLLPDAFQNITWTTYIPHL